LRIRAAAFPEESASRTAALPRGSNRIHAAPVRLQLLSARSLRESREFSEPLLFHPAIEPSTDRRWLDSQQALFPISPDGDVTLSRFPSSAPLAQSRAASPDAEFHPARQALSRSWFAAWPQPRQQDRSLYQGEIEMKCNDARAQQRSPAPSLCCARR